MKKLIISLTFIPLLFACTSCSSKKNAVKEGKVLNIACWNDEFKNRFNDYFVAKGLLPADITVNWIQTANQNNMYQNNLDELLVFQKDKPADERIDLFLIESDYALKYTNTGYTLDVKKDIGLTDEDLSLQYQYTKDVMTDSNGKLKGVSWQACPGGFIYRRSIAKAVLGTDDPDAVQKALSDWDSFDNVAALAKEKGYFMLSGYDDAFRVFYGNIKEPLVKNNKINIDSSIKRWITQTKKYTEAGYNNKANLFSDKSFEGAKIDGKVFGYFGPAWFIDYCLAPASLQFPKAEKQPGNGSYGDWAFCSGPQAFSWGGTWICAAAGTDNISLIKEIMYTLTCKKDVMAAIAKEAGDFTNNLEAMQEIAQSDYKNPFLGGQNHITPFLKNATEIRRDCISPYDQGISENLQQCFSHYFEGFMTEDEAWDYFYNSVSQLYPNLSK